MKPSRDQPLLNELLTGTEVAGFREATLNHALDEMRRARRRRNLSKTILVTVLPAMILTAAVLIALLDRVPREAGHAIAAPIVGSATPTEASSVEFISDAELLALFPERPLALIGPEGRQNLVFLDRPIRQ